jgi:hypothetical protein
MMEEDRLIGAWTAARPSDASTERARTAVLAAARPRREPGLPRWARSNRVRRSLMVAAATLVIAGGALAAIVRPGDGPDRPVPVIGRPAVELPPSVAAAVAPGTIRLAVTAYGYDFYTARGATPGQMCLLFAPAVARPDVTPTSCGPPDARVLNMLTQVDPDHSLVGAVVVPRGAASVKINGVAATVRGGVAPFRFPDPRAVRASVTLADGSRVTAALPAVPASELP